MPQPAASASPAAPPPAPVTSAGPAGDVATRLRKLDELRDTGLLTDEEFRAKKAELLREL